ncbi:hypothetical protein DWUX_534 [Desulfovibrio diazotrophicus]|nr:hypothetical protein DWUX_534 [Desulfovibrio diazotrophicus]VVU42780.1 hypothetical protein DWUX_126 [Desulfovibrio diazotrophicus]
MTLAQAATAFKRMCRKAQVFSSQPLGAVQSRDALRGRTRLKKGLPRLLP